MPISIRPADEPDIALLARIKQASYGGYADVMYADAVPGMTPRQLLELRLEFVDTTSHFSQGCIAESDGKAVGGYNPYPVDDETHDPPDSFIPSDRVPYFAPFEGMVVPGSYYLDSISVEEGCRGKGFGAALMNHALKTGGEAGFEKISLLVLENNEPAARLYRQTGFETIMHRPVMPHPALKFAGNLLLMAMDL